MKKSSFLALAALVAGSALQVAPAFCSNDVVQREVTPDGKGFKTIQQSQSSQAGTETVGGGWGTNSGGLRYHGGPIILGTTKVYYIWYGNWTGNTATTILVDFANSIGGSPYYNINTQLYDGSRRYVSNSVSYGGSTTDNYSRGSNISDADVQSIVADAITSARLPKDANGVYFVLTSSDVAESSGFCGSYCGWHTWSTISGTAIKYSFVGNPDRCLSSCAWQSTSPNSNAGADGMISIVAHELEEAVTDPQLNAWYSRLGQENADKCAWKFGTTYMVGNGSIANMRLGARDYLIQQNWSYGPAKCALSYP
jgi:hypothetical protein